MEPNSWPADKVERWPIGRLVPYARNARTHSEAQIEQVAASIREWGWTNPVLVGEDGGIIAGHCRVLAGRQLGLAEVPVMLATGWSEAQKRAYILADNQLGLNAGWNPELLRLELGELQGLEFDLALIGFDDAQLTALTANPGLTDPDEVPEPPAVPIAQVGEVWQLGRHRLLCGDATDAAAVQHLMAGELVDLCFTSPPYAQQRDYGAARAHVQDWDALMRGVFAGVPMAPAGQVLVNLGLVHRNGEWIPYWDGWIEWMRENGWRRFGWYVWDQGFGLPGDWNGRLAPSHEFIFHFNRVANSVRKSKDKKPENVRACADGASTMRHKDGITRKFTSPEASAQPRKIPDTVIRINRQVGRISSTLDHPAVFPTGLPCEILNAFSNSGQTVYDPFVGSGTTIIAAEMTGRTCHALEINPAYVDVTIERWQNFTGEKAKRLEAA